MNLIPESRPEIAISFIFACTFVLFDGARAQGTDFSPVAEDIPLLTNLSGKYHQRFKEDLDKLPSKNKKDFQEVYTLRWENVKEKFDKQEIYTSPIAQQYLDGLAAEIRRGNPQLRDRAFTCYFSRSAIPNASYIGEGIILFNMGLFDRLGNEGEAAFVLCHEIAHFLLRHPENSIDKYVATINSPEVQAELRRIKGSEYRKSEQLQKLVKGLTFDSRRHSRDHESEADSMGVELLRNTRFDVSSALTALALLDEIDTDTLNTAACLQKTFNASGYPFQKKWIVKEEGLLGGHAHIKEEEMKDSLKTHPDCKLRIRLLAPLCAKSRQAVSLRFVSDSSKFHELQRVFRYESIEYAYASDNYAGSLFLTLELLQARPGDAYLVAQAGKILNGLYSAQKGHTLSKVAELPSPVYRPNYNLLLQFIQNLYLEDIAAISYNYLARYHPQMDRYRMFKEAYEQSEKVRQQYGPVQK
jgi:Zn-dependent protease with chaperone function